MISLAFMQRLNFGWLKRCFSDNVAISTQERAIRLYEEVCELNQAEKVPLEILQAQLLHTYSRDIGELEQEGGGVMVCLLGWAEARGFNLQDLWETEFNRINEPEMIVKIREKHAAKMNKAETNRKGAMDIEQRQQHDWKMTDLGHSDRYCKRCGATPRELTALGHSATYCDGPLDVLDASTLVGIRSVVDNAPD